jgi:hypothetical protein
MLSVVSCQFSVFSFQFSAGRSEEIDLHHNMQRAPAPSAPFPDRVSDRHLTKFRLNGKVRC